MPTGYTAPIKDGITFRKFALNCARNFGAAIVLRDEDSDVEPTPENVRLGGNYYEKSLQSAKQAKTKFDKLSQKQKRQMFERETEQILSQCRKSHCEMKMQKERYLHMLNQVESWIPPTKDHKNMKDFMISQIKESIDFDCNSEYNNSRIISAVTQTYPEWLKFKKEEIARNIEYYTDELKSENRRNNERSQWIKDLLDSLPKEK